VKTGFKVCFHTRNVYRYPTSTSRRHINHHFTLRDAAGDSLVVEFVNGRTTLHHAAVGLGLFTALFCKLNTLS
jgi:penicillin V acylase-like amidase (Ntn superfamily)